MEIENVNIMYYICLQKDFNQVGVIKCLYLNNSRGITLSVMERHVEKDQSGFLFVDFIKQINPDQDIMYQQVTLKNPWQTTVYFSPTLHVCYKMLLFYSRLKKLPLTLALLILW